MAYAFAKVLLLKGMQEKMLIDTSAQAQAVMIDLYRRMPGWRKLELVEDATRTARQLAFCGLRSRHPGESLERLRRRLAGLVLGEELAEKVYGPLDAVT